MAFYFILISNLQSLFELLALNGNKNSTEKFKELFLYRLVQQ